MKRVAKVSMRSDVLGSRDLPVKVEFRQHPDQTIIPICAYKTPRLIVSSSSTSCS